MNNCNHVYGYVPCEGPVSKTFKAGGLVGKRDDKGILHVDWCGGLMFNFCPKCGKRFNISYSDYKELKKSNKYEEWQTL